MKKFNTSPISGAQELTPALQAQFDKYKSGLAEVFRAHGFQHIETPVIERTEVLLAKAGGETEKQIYKVVKTNETSGEADQALRFDHTVPLARYTVEHMNELAFPFKVTQIGRNFRGERAQKGRFREFYQCDVDVVGRGELALAYDAEVIATLGEVLATKFPLAGGFTVHLSNRKLLAGLLEKLGLTEKAAEIFGIIDHAMKVPAATTTAALEELGIGAEVIARIMDFVEIRGGSEEAIMKLRAIDGGEVYKNGVDELEEVAEAVRKLAPNLDVEIDTKIVRGLDYYTGTVFETTANGYEKQFGSICSGGRYENLAGFYTDQKLPGVGGSIGLTRLFALLSDAGLVRADEKAIEICVVPVSAGEIEYAGQVAAELRADGKTVDLVLSDRRLGDKLKYAAKVAQNVVVIGEDEVKSGAWELRELK